jgi:hypothetical protein
MGQGKKESDTTPKEYHQLLRARHLLKKFMSEPEFAGLPQPKIKLYFVGWSAPSNSAVVWGKPLWVDSIPAGDKVMKINAQGMIDTGCPINHALVTKIISVLNLQKAIGYYEALKKYFEPWGEGRPALNEWVNSTLTKIKTESGNHNNAIKQPPLGVTTRLKAKKAIENQAKTESKLRGLAGGVVTLAGRVAGAAVGGARLGASALMRSYAGSRGKSYARSSPNNVRFCAEAFSHGTRGGSRCQALLAASPSISRNMANILALKQKGINHKVIETVMANTNNFDKVYNNFVKVHGGAPSTNLGLQLINVLSNPPSNQRANNFAEKLEKIRSTNIRAVGRAAARNV